MTLTVATEIFHHERDEAENYATIKVEVEITPHGGVQIVCHDASGSRTDVWLENCQGILALRAYVPDTVEVQDGKPVSFSHAEPFLNSRLTMKRSVVQIGADDNGGISGALSVNTPKEDVDFASRVARISARDFQGAIHKLEIRADATEATAVDSDVS